MEIHLLLTWVLLVGLSGSVVEGLGVNWGTMSTHRLPPNTVLQLLRDNGIKKVKLFDTDESTMRALVGTGMEVMVGIPNDQLASMNDYDTAVEWVRTNVTRYNFKGGVNITYVAVGNEPFLESYDGSFLNTTFPAVRNIQNALNAAGLGSTVKATIPLSADVFESPTYSPSGGQFRPDINELMTQIAAFFNQTKSPFTVNIFPFLSLYRHPHFPRNFAFFDGIGQPLIDLDNGIQYTNKFDTTFDTLVWALKRAGFPDMPIIIGEVGWPTDGDINANTLLAQRFYNGLMERMAVNQGAPLRPNTFIEVYLSGLLDEDAKSIARGDFERHWGIFTCDGQPKFQIDLGQNSSLVGAKNFKYLKQSWISKVTNLLWVIWMEKNNVRFNISKFAAFCADMWHKGGMYVVDAMGI